MLSYWVHTTCVQIYTVPIKWKILSILSASNFLLFFIRFNLLIENDYDGI